LKRNLKCIFAASTLLCCLLRAGPAAAQNSPSDIGSSSAASVEEIVVTARKRSENIQTVPISITAFSGLELQEQSVRTIADMQSQIPGLFLQQAPDDPQSLTFTMRGRKQSDVNLAVDPAVGLYVDGLSIPRTLGMAGSLLDINRVEVLRGPQGTLYGRNTTGGAISLYTNNPTRDFGGSVDITGGNFGAWNAIGIANLPLSENLAARFVFQRGTHDGYGSSLVNRPLDSEDSQYYRGKLRWTSDNAVDAILSAHYESNHSGGAIIKLIALTPSRSGLLGGSSTLETAAETGLTIPQSIAYLQTFIAKSKSNFYDNGGASFTFSNLKRWDVGLNVAVQLPADLEFRWISGAQGLRREEFVGSPVPVTLLTGAFHTEDKYYSQELQLLGTKPTFNWVVGLYGGYETGQDNSGILLLPVINPGLGTNDSGIRNGNAAAYAQTTWEFVPQWHFTSGARYSVDTRRADVVALVDTTCVVPAPGVESTFQGAAQCPRTFKDTFRQPTWLVSLDHQFTPQVTTYVKVAKGYRSGGENEGGAVELETFAPFQPETNVEYESGIKSELLDHKIRLNVSAYLDKYRNVQTTTQFIAADGNYATAVRSAAQVTTEGFEAESDFILTPHLTMHASAAYTDAHYDRFVDVTGDRSGEPFEVPRWTWSLSGRHMQPMAVGELTVQLDYNWKSATVLSGTAKFRELATQAAVGLLNARANLHLHSWDLDVALFGRNITSQKYLDRLSAYDSFGVYVGYPGAPAIYGIEVTKKFGK
jgi:iron complex outermembrane receptor protein